MASRKSARLTRVATLLCLAAVLAVSSRPATAATAVFELKSAFPDEVTEAIRAVHGDAVRVEWVRQRLVAVGSERDLDAVAELLEQIDLPPRPLRLTLATSRPPAAAGSGTTYAAGDPRVALDTVEGALVAIAETQLAQLGTADGWLVDIDETPVAIRSLTLQVRRIDADQVAVLVSFARQTDGHRQIFGNERLGRLGEWLPLLPRSDASTHPSAGRSFHSGAARDQLWVRIDASH